MSFRVQCETCLTRLQIDDKYSGRRVRCPVCKSVFRVHATTPPAPPGPVAVGHPPDEFAESVNETELELTEVAEEEVDHLADHLADQEADFETPAEPPQKSKKDKKAAKKPSRPGFFGRLFGRK